MPDNRPSFEKVDYTVRPAKNIERKMFAEMFARLRVVQPLEDYAYVGLGSTFFSDFVLFHKLLGINRMVSIEKLTDHSDRIMFNKPYRCIEVEFGETTDALPRLDWSRPAIVWLDYDDDLDRRKLEDLVYLAQNLSSSSFLLVTLPSFPKSFQAGDPPVLRNRLDVMQSVLGDRVPDSLQSSDTGNLPEAQRRIANAVIAEALVSRNAGVTESARINYRQTLYFRYADSTDMVTFGGLFLTRADSRRVNRSRLRDLPFYRPNEVHYHLNPPKLTVKERHCLDKQLPGSGAECPGVPDDFVREYAGLYRYFPYFVEAEV